jgi:hypothetical protein
MARSIARSLFLFAANFYFFPVGLQLLPLIEIERTHTIVTRKKGRLPQMMKPWPAFIKSFHKCFSNK